jgi:hypothetical protein
MAARPHPEGPPPRAYTTLFDLILHTRKLNALDVVALGACNKELRAATQKFWGQVAAESGSFLYGRVQTDLLLDCPARAVDEKRQNFEHSRTRRDKTPYNYEVRSHDMLPLNAARPCRTCGELTRLSHPMTSALVMCGPCGEAIQRAPLCWSRLARLRMITQPEAIKRFRLAADSGLERRLNFIVRPASAGLRYANLAPSVEAARCAAEPVEGGGNVRVFLLHEIACVLLRLYGGPRLLRERICNLNVGPLRLYPSSGSD